MIRPIKDTFKLLVADAKMGLDENDRKAHYATAHEGKKLVELAERMKELNELKDYIENMLLYANAEYDIIRINLIPKAMEAENLESPVTVAGVGRITLTGDMFVSIGNAEPEEGVDYKQEFYNWLHQNGMGDLIQETVNASTLKAWVKKRITEGAPYPSDLLKVTPFTRASITKAK